MLAKSVFVRQLTKNAFARRCSSSNGLSFGKYLYFYSIYIKEEISNQSFTEFTDEQKQLRDAVRKFVKEEIIPVAAEYDKSMEFPWPIVKKAHANGFLNLDVPSEYGNILKTWEH